MLGVSKVLVTDLPSRFCRFQYQCGTYEMAQELLKHYRMLTANDTSSNNTSKQLNALWGSLACCVRRAPGPAE